MDTIVNTSFITDYAGEPPIIVYSNPVTTVIRQDFPETTSTRYFYDLCRCCCCCCNCCDCD